MRCVTADLVDAYESQVKSCAVQFRQMGGRASFFGPVRTLRTFEDNALLKQMVQTPGGGAVLVVDGGGSVRTALMGDNLGADAVAHGWAGVIVHGAVRDSMALAELALGIKALGTNPLKSAKKGDGAMDVPVTFGGVTFDVGMWVYCDADGILVAPVELELGASRMNS